MAHTPLAAISATIYEILSIEVAALRALAGGAEWSDAHSERLGRAVRALGQLEEQHRRTVEYAARAGAELGSEDALRALCADREFRVLALRVLAATCDGSERGV